MKAEEKWVRKEPLGQGSFGTVWLESCSIGGKTDIKAVKEVSKNLGLRAGSGIIPGEAKRILGTP